MLTLPNILSFTRIILAPFFFVAYIQPDPVVRALSIAIFAVAAVTDYFDGYLARTFDSDTQIGVFLDPLADKILTFAGFLCLPLVHPTVFPWLPVLIIIARDVAVTGMRLLATIRKREVKTLQSAKIKTFTQMIFLYLALLAGLFAVSDLAIGSMARLLFESGAFTVALWVITAVTLYTAGEYLLANRHLFKRHVEEHP